MFLLRSKLVLMQRPQIHNTSKPHETRGRSASTLQQQMQSRLYGAFKDNKVLHRQTVKIMLNI